MEQRKPRKPRIILQVEEPKVVQSEKSQVENEKSLENSAIEVQTSECENKSNGNEIQSSATESTLPLESKLDDLADEITPVTENVSKTESESNIESVVDTEIVPNSETVPETEIISHSESVSVTENVPDSESVPDTKSVSNTETISNSEPISNSESLLTSEPLLNIEIESNKESIIDTKPEISIESLHIEKSDPDTVESEQNEDSELQNTESQSADLSNQSQKDKAGIQGRNQKRGFKTPKAGSCDKYGWPIGSKYCTEVEESIETETNLIKDEDTVTCEIEGEKDKISQDINQLDEEILFTVTSPVHKRANTKRTIIKVEEVEGAITDGIHAGTHLPHFLTYLSWKIKFRLTLVRLSDKKLKITIRFGGKGGDTLKNIICLWLRREDEDKDKIICEGLSRNKEEILILLAQKFHEMEHLKEDPIELYENIKKLVPELRGKEGLRSEDESFLSSYQDLDDKLRILMMILYREGCGREGKNHKTLSQFRDMYFSLQLKPGFTVKQYLWAFYYYNLVFTPCLPRDLDQMMQKYASLKNITLPDTPALIFPPGGQTTTSTVINPFAKKNLQKQNNLPKENSYAEYEMVTVKTDDFVSQEKEEFKKPINPRQRNAQRRRQANQRNRKATDTGNNQVNLSNQKNLPNQRTVNQRISLNPRNTRNQSNQRNLLNQRNNSRQQYNQKNQRNLKNLSNQKNSANQRNQVNKRRQGNQGGPANKKRTINRSGLENTTVQNQSCPVIEGDSVDKIIPVESTVTQRNQSNQLKPTNRRNQQNQRKPPGQRNNLPNQRSNQPNQRRNQPHNRNNLPNQRRNQSNQRVDQLNQRNIQQNQRNNSQNSRNNPPNQRNNQQRNSRSRRRSENFRKNRPNQELNFSMPEMSRNQSFSSPNTHEFLLNSLRNQDFMQHNNLRDQDFGRSQNFSNQRNQNFTSSNSRNQNFSQGNHSRNNNFSQTNAPRSLFSQDFYDLSRNQNYSQNNSPGQNFSQQNPRRLSVWSSDFIGTSQDFFSGPSNFSNRSSPMNRNMGDMQFSTFNSRMPFDNEMNAHNFSNSSPNNDWDNNSKRGKRRNFGDSWHSKRQKQGTYNKIKEIQSKENKLRKILFYNNTNSL